jgi:hypothetical protein
VKNIFDMTDTELESMAISPRRALGYSPWAAWESERTGFGLGFRRAAHYPSGLPLFFTSDHYVSPLIELRENETKPKYGVYLSWNAQKVDILREAGVDAIHCKHPWNYLNLDTTYEGESRNGTLVFWPHSHEAIHEDTNTEHFVSALMDLPEYYRPFTLCLMSYDISKLGLHKKLRKYGFPLTTVGDVNSQKYPYRFFRLMKNFWFAAGPSVGTQIYYTILSGRPYRMVGRETHKEKVMTGSNSWYYKLYEDQKDVLYPDVELRKKVSDFEASLELNIEQPLEMQIKFTRENMGMNSAVTRKDLRKIIWEQLLVNTKTIPSLYLRR